MVAKVSESDIARTIDAWLDLGARQNYWLYMAARQPNPKTPGREGAGVGSMSKGQPDRMLFLLPPHMANYHCIAVEIKTKTGRPSDEQKDWLGIFGDSHWQRGALVVRSLPELKEQLKELGVRCPEGDVW